MLKNKMLALTLVCALFTLGLPLLAVATLHGAPGKDPPKLDDSNYRLKVETILEPVGQVAIYRVEIWTTEKRAVYLDYDDGVMRREKGAKGYYAYFVIYTSIREPDQGAGKRQLEFQLLVGGARGAGFQSEDIGKTAQLAKVINLDQTDAVHKLRDRPQIGRFRGKAIEIGVEELKAPKR